MVPILCKLKALLENTVLTSKNKITKNKTVFKMYLNPFEIGIKNIFPSIFFKAVIGSCGWLDFAWVSEGLPSSGGLQLNPLNAS